MNRKAQWTAEADDVMLAAYGKVQVAILAKQLDRTQEAIRRRAITLKLTKPRDAAAA